jgi:ribonuclease T1
MIGSILTRGIFLILLSSAGVFGPAMFDDLWSGARPAAHAMAERPAGKGTGLQSIQAADLPTEARQTLKLIKGGGPFPYPKDGSTFGNREGRLPKHPHGYYKEYTVKTPGRSDRGARRIVAGSGGELFYTDDHYSSFKLIKE